MTTLHDTLIRRLGTQNVIKPYDPALVQPSSYDVRLGTSFRVFSSHRTDAIDIGDPSTYADITEECLVEEGEKFTLHAGEFALAVTEESFDIPTNILARLEGKSSLGRLGLIVHATAGYIDPGFRGRVTLELSNLMRVPIILRPGMPVAQISFSYMSGNAMPYSGHYQGDDTAVASRYTG